MKIEVSKRDFSGSARNERRRERPHLRVPVMTILDPLDRLLWPDGFWCLREELHPHFLRDDSYRVIPHLSQEWHDLSQRQFAKRCSEVST